ncbi:MAG: hypothetical protein WAQ27_04240 [Candidatus Microsaccharimonas sp.]
MKHHVTKFWPLWVGGLLVLLVGIWGVYYFVTKNDTASTESAKVTQKTNVTPHLIDTNDALTRYVQALGDEKIGGIAEGSIHLTETPDWNDEVLVALKFDILQAQTFNSASVEQIDGVTTYVIDITDAPNDCAVAQVQAIHVAFVRQSDTNTAHPVILRVTPSTVSCDSIQ